MSIQVLHTGGTISTIDADERRITDPDELSEQDTDVVERQIMNKLSENMRPSDWSVIARRVRESSKEHDGIVVTHGTDTMTYTINAVDLMLDLNVPVVFAGSLLPPDDSDSRARTTLSNALAFARQYDQPGVFLAFPGYEEAVTKVLYGPETQTMRTYGQSFYSQNQQSVATLEDQTLRVENETGQTSNNSDLYKLRDDSPVRLVTMNPSMHHEVIQEASGTAPTVVLDLYPSGTAPKDPMILQAIREGSANTDFVAPIPFSRYDPPFGSTKALRKAGVTFFEKITRERLLVGATMALSSHTDSVQYLANLFRS